MNQLPKSLHLVHYPVNCPIENQCSKTVPSSDYYVRQVNGVKVADILFSLCVSVRPSVRPSVCVHSVPLAWMCGMILRNVWQTSPTLCNSNIMFSTLIIKFITNKVFIDGRLQTLLGRRVCKYVDVYMITLSCTWRTCALSERLLVCYSLNFAVLTVET